MALIEVIILLSLATEDIPKSIDSAMLADTNDFSVSSLLVEMLPPLRIVPTVPGKLDSFKCAS